MFLSKLRLQKKNLIFKQHQKKGRNNTGKITVGQRGGGSKQLYRKLSLTKKDLEKALVLNIEYDPNRSNFIAKVLYKKKGSLKYYYMPCNNKLNVLQDIKKVDQNLIPNKFYNEGFPFLIQNLAVGDIISNIEKMPNQGSVFAKSAGSFGQIIELNAKNNNFVCIQLPSKELYYIPKNCTAILGRNSNRFYQNLRKWKAGSSRNVGRRPHVRGVAKNPVDHPHGGGEGKTSTGRPPVSPQGLLTKGVPTRKKKKNSFFIALRKKYTK